MTQGINNDLADITVYTLTTPVHFTTSNVPLSELDTNIVLLDQKLEGWLQSSDQAMALGGDGNTTVAVMFTTTMNTIPRIAVSLADVSGTGASTLYVSVLNRTTAGFDMSVDGVGTSGAWTVNVSWVADGR